MSPQKLIKTEYTRIAYATCLFYDFFMRCVYSSYKSLLLTTYSRSIFIVYTVQDKVPL